jgi:hypothetical protein
MDNDGDLRFWLTLEEYNRYARELDARLPPWVGTTFRFSQVNPWTTSPLDAERPVCILTGEHPEFVRPGPQPKPAALRWTATVDSHTQKAPSLLQAFPDLIPVPMHAEDLGF